MRQGLALVGLAAIFHDGLALAAPSSNATAAAAHKTKLKKEPAKEHSAAPQPAEESAQNHKRTVNTVPAYLPESVKPTRHGTNLSTSHLNHFHKSKELVESSPAQKPDATAAPPKPVDSSTSAVSVLKLIFGVLIVGGLSVACCSSGGVGFIEAVKSGDPTSLPPHVLSMGCFFTLVTIQSTAILLFKACQLSGDYSFSPAGAIVFSERKPRRRSSLVTRGLDTRLRTFGPPPWCWQSSSSCSQPPSIGGTW